MDRRNSPNSYQGDDPVGASEHIGKVLCQLNAAQVAEIYKVYKEDQNLVERNREHNTYL